MPSDTPSWRLLHAAIATQDVKIFSTELKKQLDAADLTTYRHDGRTTKGTACIRIYVEAGKYSIARRLMDGLEHRNRLRCMNDGPQGDLPVDPATILLDS